MAVVAVAFDGTRVDTADALGSVWLDLAGKAANLEPDFVYQRSTGTDGSVSEKVGTSELGIKYYDSATSHDYTTGHASGVQQTAILKVIATNKDVLNVEGSTGGILEIGSGDRTNYYRYYVVGSDTYPKAGGWLVIPINPNLSGYVDATPASAPTLTAIDMYAWACTFSASSKSQNVAMDAIDFIPNGKGLTLTAGDGASADGVFQDFADFDEGTLGNSYGIMTSKEGIFYALGTLTIGSGTATEFTDTNQVVVFPDGRFNAGFCGMAFDLSNASTSITISDCVFKGNGTKAGTADTRPDYTATGTSATTTFTSNTFNIFRNWTMTSAVEMASCNFLGGQLVTMSSAILDSCSFAAGTQASGEHYLLTTSPAFLSGICDFTSGGAGHAIRCDTVGTYNWRCTDVGYTGTRGTNLTSSSGSTDAMFYNNSGGLITLNVQAGAQSPSVRNGAGATTVVNAGTVIVRINVDDENGDPLSGARILLEAADDTGIYPYMENVTITRSGATATVAHTAHGLATGDRVVIRGADQPEYNGPFSITVTGPNAYTYAVSGTPATPATGNRLSTGQDETSYDNSPTTEGTFSGGTGHTALDVLTLDKNVLVTVDAVSGGVVTQFTVDSTNSRPDISATDVLSQVSSTGSGVNFSLTVDADNLTVSSNGAILSGETTGTGFLTASRSFSLATPMKGYVRKGTTSPFYRDFNLAGNTISTSAGLTVNVRMVPDE